MTFKYIHILLLVFPLISIFLLTLGHDEAWLLQSIRNLVENGIYASGVYLGPLTTGGLYTIGQVVVGSIFPGKIIFARFFSYICLVLLYMEVLKCNRKSLGDDIAILLATSTFFMVPGVMVLTSQAFGFVPATLLSFYAVSTWNNSNGSKKKKIISTGILLGFACATRVNFFVLLPGFLLWVIVHKRNRKENFNEALTVVLIAILIIIIDLKIISFFSPDRDRLAAETLTNSGFNFYSLDYVKFLNKWHVLNEYISLPLAVFITAIAFISWNGRELQELKVLLVTGWMMLFAWLFFSPIPHLRYIWPALFYIFIYGGQELGMLYVWANKKDNFILKRMIFIVSFSVLLTGGFFGVSQIAQGNSDLLSFEWSRESELLPFRRFRHIQDQNAIKKYIKTNVPENEVLGILYSSITMKYLTGHDYIGPLEWKAGLFSNAKLPDRLIIDPLIGSYLYPDPTDWAYLIENSEIEYRSGDYYILKINRNNFQYDRIFECLSRGYPDLSNSYQKRAFSK